MASVPSWKQALLQKKRRQEDDDRRRFEQEQKRLAEMPSWKRDLILKKKKIHDGPTGDKNVVIIESSASNKHVDGVNGRNYYPEFSGSQRTTPDSGFDETEDGAHRAGHPAYIQESRWVQVNSAKATHQSSKRTQHDIPDGLPVENGVSSVREKGSKHVGLDSDEELTYQPGFVHKLLDKFSHMTVKERVRRVSQGGTEHSSDDSGGSAKSSPRYESDYKDNPSRVLHGSNENLSHAQIKPTQISPDEKVRKEHSASKEQTVSSKERVTIERVETIPGEGKVVIVSTSLKRPGASIPNGGVHVEPQDGKVTVKKGKKDEKPEEPVVKNIVSSVRNIFETNKKRAAPAVPKVTETVRQSQSVPKQTPEDVRSRDSVRIIPSQVKSPNSSDGKVLAQSQSGDKVRKVHKKGTPDSEAIQKIRDAGQSWYYGKDEPANDEIVNKYGATDMSSGFLGQDSVRIVDAKKPEMVEVGKDARKVEMIEIERKVKEEPIMVEVAKRTEQIPVASYDAVVVEPVIKEKPKPEPPKNIEIAQKEPSKTEKKRVTEPPKSVKVKTEPEPELEVNSRPASTNLTMVEVKVKNTPRDSVIINPSAPPRKRRHAPPAPRAVKTPAPPRPVENNNVAEPKHVTVVKVENVTTDQTDVDTGKIIITDTEEDNIPVTNIDDMILDEEDDIDIDITDVKSRKVAPPSGIDTHLDLSGILNEEPETEVSPAPSPVRPCNISFVGEGVKLDRSLLMRSRSKDGRNIRFTESTPEIHEYPSETTMMAMFPHEEEEEYSPTVHSNISDEDTDEETDMVDRSLMTPNPAVGAPGSALGSYKGRYVGDYQLGAAPTPSGRPLAQRIIPEPEPEPEELQIKPADEDETFAWSDATNSDMLF